MAAAMKTVLKLILLLLQLASLCTSIRLSTYGRFIVDQSGKRVKLTCVNWSAHMDLLLPEGLDKQPLVAIAAKIQAAGFNCVRMNTATYMFTRLEYGNVTIPQTLDLFPVPGAKAGVARNNPGLLGVEKNVLDGLMAAVDELGKRNLMVIVDNTVSSPGWCCSDDDGNGFFGDQFFDPYEWLRGLIIMANIFKHHPAVIGISLRNELRGSRQNEAEWYEFMVEGAMAVHKENPDFLVIVSGLSYAGDLGFLHRTPLGVGNLGNKLVYEAHWYAFGNSAQKWAARTNYLCGLITNSIIDKFMFVTQGQNPFPLFLSEFGIDQRGINEADNRYISCLLATVAELDVDWALWTFQGSYFLRQGQANFEETYGVMDFNWNQFRNPQFLSRLDMIRAINIANNQSPIYRKLFHPQSGKCLGALDGSVFLVNCKAATLWANHVDGEPIRAARAPQCVSLDRNTGRIGVGGDCGTMWTRYSKSGLHLVTDIVGGYLCMDAMAGRIVTNQCVCLGDEECAGNPEGQWFKFVPTNVGTS